MNKDLPEQSVTFAELNQTVVLLRGVTLIPPDVEANDETNHPVILGDISGNIDDAEISLALSRVADVVTLILSSEAPRCRYRSSRQDARIGHLRVRRGNGLLLPVDDSRIDEDPLGIADQNSWHSLG